MLHMMFKKQNETPEPPRYEFRVFGEAAARTAERFEALGSKSEFECRTDIYILFEGRLDFSLKLRSDALDLKTLEHESQRLELWHPVRRASMPLTGSDILSGFLPAEMSETPLSSSRIHDHNALLEVLGPLENVRIFRVAKERHRFTFNGDLGEVTVARIPGNGTHVTCAVEGTVPARLKTLKAELGLTERENTSYLRFLANLETARETDTKFSEAVS